MEAPSALALECPHCGEVTPHRVLKGRVGVGAERVFEGTVKCNRCGLTHGALVREPMPKTVPLVVSWLDKSERREFDLGVDEMVELGQRLDTPEGPVEVTAIEVGGRRVREAAAGDVDTLWAKRVDRVRLKFTINRRDVTVARELLVEPDREFAVGQEVTVGPDRVIIHRILKHTGALLHEGTAAAELIRRVYARGPARPRGRRP